MPTASLYRGEPQGRHALLSLLLVTSLPSLGLNISRESVGLFDLLVLAGAHHWDPDTAGNSFLE